MGKSNRGRRAISISYASVGNNRAHGNTWLGGKGAPPRVAPQMRHGAKAPAIKNDRATPLTTVTTQEYAR